MTRAPTGDPDDGAGDRDELAIEVHLSPAQGTGLTDAGTGGKHERHQVDQVSTDGSVVVGEEREELSRLGFVERGRCLLAAVLDSPRIAYGVPVDRVVAGCEACHARQHGPDRPRRRGSVLCCHGGQVTVDRSRGQLSDAQFAEGRNDLSVEPVAILDQSRWGAVARRHVAEPGLRKRGNSHIRSDLCAVVVTGAITHCLGKRSFGFRLRGGMALDLAGDAVIVTVGGAGSPPGGRAVAPDAAAGAEAKWWAGHDVHRPPCPGKLPDNNAKSREWTSGDRGITADSSSTSAYILITDEQQRALSANI